MEQNKFWQILSKGGLFDTHAHLNDFSPYEIDSIINSLRQSRVNGVFDISVDLKSSEKSLEISKRYKDLVFPSVGIDPEIFIVGSSIFDRRVFNSRNFDDWLSHTYSKMSNILERNDIYLLGETGIDNYWLVVNSVDKTIAQRSIGLQSELFRLHIKLSKKFMLPLSIHSRNATDKVIGVLEENNVTSRYAIFHSLTPDLNDTEHSFYKKVNEILKFGYFIGLNGIITYKSANILRNVIRKILKENIKRGRRYDILDLYNLGFVFETDSPFLAPEPLRGRSNTPLSATKIYEFVINNIL